MSKVFIVIEKLEAKTLEEGAIMKFLALLVRNVERGRKNGIRKMMKPIKIDWCQESSSDFYKIMLWTK